MSNFAIFNFLFAKLVFPHPKFVCTTYSCLSIFSTFRSFLPSLSLSHSFSLYISLSFFFVRPSHTAAIIHVQNYKLSHKQLLISHMAVMSSGFWGVVSYFLYFPFCARRCILFGVHLGIGLERGAWVVIAAVVTRRSFCFVNPKDFLSRVVNMCP